MFDEATARAFFDIHDSLPRGGPGSDASTRRAFALIEGLLPASPRILDIGCGPGMQTLELARLSDGPIVAVDNHQPFLDTLAESARAEGLPDRLEIVNASMTDLPFEDESFDLIWCEGAIFIIGFAEGFRQWKRLLKPGGVIAVTEAAWLRPDPPAETRAFWDRCYPVMQDIAGNLRDIRDNGYEILNHFTLPPEDWWDHYYTPMERRIEALRDKYANDPAGSRVMQEAATEIEAFRRSEGSYSYVFFLARKPVA
jgi:SAM-dependent methyltransferase